MFRCLCVVVCAVLCVVCMLCVLCACLFVFCCGLVCVVFCLQVGCVVVCLRAVLCCRNLSVFVVEFSCLVCVLCL